MRSKEVQFLTDFLHPATKKPSKGLILGLNKILPFERFKGNEKTIIYIIKIGVCVCVTHVRPSVRPTHVPMLSSLSVLDWFAWQGYQWVPYHQAHVLKLFGWRYMTKNIICQCLSSVLSTNYVRLSVHPTQHVRPSVRLTQNVPMLSSPSFLVWLLWQGHW